MPQSSNRVISSDSDTNTLLRNLIGVAVDTDIDTGLDVDGLAVEVNPSVFVDLGAEVNPSVFGSLTRFAGMEAGVVFLFYF